MIKSMTGIGRSELNDEKKTIIVELRSVNNKYLKINMRMPELLTGFEDKIEKLLKKELVRGTINLTIEYKACDQVPKCVINKDILKEYHNIISEAREEISIKQDVTLDNLLSQASWNLKRIQETERQRMVVSGRSWNNWSGFRLTT